MNSTSLKRLYAKNIALLRLLFSFLVNGFTFLGILVWQWNFFTVIYLYWFEEVIRIFFKVLENRINYSKDRISKPEFQEKSKANWTMFFPMGIYFVFIVIINGFIATPSHEVWIDNLAVILFKDTEFNLNLLLATFVEILILLYISTKKWDKEKVSEQEFLRNQREKEAKNAVVAHQNMYSSMKNASQNNQVFSTQMLVLHLSIIFGTLLYFAANTDKLPIQINLGAAGEFAFVIVFAIIQTLGEIIAFWQERKK